MEINTSEKYERQMKKGVLDMLVLRLLEPEPKYGYQLIQELKAKSEEVFVLKDGTLYPILYRLQDEGLVISKWSEASGTQVPRKYYEITQKGQQELTIMQQSWRGIAEGVNRIMEV